MISGAEYAPPGMGIGPDPHIPPQGLDHRTYASALRSTWRLERRGEGGAWTTIGVYRDSRAAGEALDHAVGAGSGDLDDYRIVRARGGGRAAWAAAAIVALIAVALLTVLIVATR
jgi:hypothetical protein